MKSVKQYTEIEIIRKAQKSLVAVLSEIPFIVLKEVKTNVKGNDGQIDIVLNILVFGKPAKFVVEIKSLGEPRFVRMAAEQVKRYSRDFKDSYGIVVAPYIGDASRQICKEVGVGCVDLAGNAFISFKNVFIDRSGIPNPLPVSKVAKSVFSPKSSRILRVLLSNPSKRWFVEDISKESSVSIGLTSRVKQALLTQEWIKEDNKKFYLVKPDKVLGEWANNYSYTKNQSFSFYSGLLEEEIEMRIKKECEKRKYQYGLTLFSGAKKVAPFVRFLRFFAYVAGDIEEIANTLELKKVETGPNMTLLTPYDEGVFYGLQNINGVNVVSDIQLYLDLKGYKGRGEESAQAVFEQRIKPKW